MKRLKNPQEAEIHDTEPLFIWRHVNAKSTGYRCAATVSSVERYRAFQQCFENETKIHYIRRSNEPLFPQEVKRVKYLPKRRAMHRIHLRCVKDFGEKLKRLATIDSFLKHFDSFLNKKLRLARWVNGNPLNRNMFFSVTKLARKLIEVSVANNVSSAGAPAAPDQELTQTHEEREVDNET